MKPGVGVEVASNMKRATVVLFVLVVFLSGLLTGHLLHRDSPAVHAVEVDALNGDLNGDSAVDITDAIYLLNFLFKRGSPPVAPRLRGASTVILVRHAEREPGACDDARLRPEGEERARELARVLARTDIDALVSSDCIRTRLTLEPLQEVLSASGKDLPIVPFASENDVVTHLENLESGSVAVVAGHSFTVLDIMVGLGLPESVRKIPVSGNHHDDLFVIQRCAGASPRLVHLRFPPFQDQ